MTQEEMRLSLFNCYKLAEKFSDDLSNQNGAIIYDPASLDCLAKGVNKLPPGVKKTDQRIKERPTKYAFVEHAERFAIFDAARRGIKTGGMAMCCPWFACADCARAIVCAGITKVIGHKQRMEATSLNRDKVKDTVANRWVNPVSDGDQILADAGVELIYYDGTIDGISVLVNEQLMTSI